MLVSQESTICDECIVTGLSTMSRQPGNLHLRFAFGIFKAIAVLGRFLIWR